MCFLCRGFDVYGCKGAFLSGSKTSEYIGLSQWGPNLAKLIFLMLEQFKPNTLATMWSKIEMKFFPCLSNVTKLKLAEQVFLLSPFKKERMGELLFDTLSSFRIFQIIPLTMYWRICTSHLLMKSVVRFVSKLC